MTINRSPLAGFLLLGIILIVLPLTVFFSQQQQQTQQHAAVSGKDLYGISGHLVGLSTADLNRSLDDFKALGVQWVRDDFDWPSIQPNNASSYTWTAYDTFVNAANARGIKILGIIDYIPQWELPSGCTNLYHCSPKSNTDYATFAAAVAAHYAPMGVHTWELWNEPNGGTFTVADYTALIKTAYPAIKSADPAAFILAGSTEPAGTSGTSYSPVDFLSGIYQNGGKGYFDAVSHHPYCFAGSSFNCPVTFANWSAWSQMQDTNPSLRSVMSANGDQDKQIWATEFGAPTSGNNTYANPVSETQQAQMVKDAYTLFGSYPWSGPLFWYTYIDYYHSPCNISPSTECFFGLVHTDYSQKPAYTFYKNLATNTVLPTTTITSSHGSTSFSLTLCPHDLGNCGDNVNPNSTGNISPRHTSRNVTLTILGTNGNQIASGQGSVNYNNSSQNYDGNISVSNLPSDQYLLSVKMDGFLGKQIPGIIPVTQGQTTILSAISLVNGDINNDNQLDIQDYNILISCFGSKQQTASCTKPPSSQSSGADINDDGVVDGADYNLFLRELSVQRGEGGVPTPTSVVNPTNIPTTSPNNTLTPTPGVSAAPSGTKQTITSYGFGGSAAYQPASSPWWALNNAWGGPPPNTQAIDYYPNNFPNNTTLRWTYGGSGGNVLGYPEIIIGDQNGQSIKSLNGVEPAWYGKTLGSLSHIIVTWDITINSKNGDNWDILFENHMMGHETGIILKNPGWFRGGTQFSNLGGISGVGIPNAWASGSFAIVPSTVMAGTPMLKGSIDLLPIFKWAISNGWMSSNESVYGWEFGVEPTNGSGSVTFNSLSVNIQ